MKNTLHKKDSTSLIRKMSYNPWKFSRTYYAKQYFSQEIINRRSCGDEQNIYNANAVGRRHVDITQYGHSSSLFPPLSIYDNEPKRAIFLLLFSPLTSSCLPVSCGTVITWSCR